MGISWNDFWKMNPHKINVISKGYEEEVREKDFLLWLQGKYVLEALNVALSHFSAGLSGKKSQAQYMKEPILSQSNSKELTDAETYEKELKKALISEEQWMVAGKKKGLPETII